MTKFLILNTFKCITSDRKSYVIFKSGEEYSLDGLIQFYNQKAITSLIENKYIQEENGTLEVIDTQQTQKEPETQEPIVENIEETQQTFEIMYKTTQQIQDKDGNEIEVETQLTAEDFKKKGFTKKKLEALIQEEKVIELKIVK